MSYLVSVNETLNIVDLFHSDVSMEIPLDAVPITDAEAEAILAHPKGAAVFSFLNGAVVLDDNREQLAAMEDARASKRGEVRAAFSRVSVEPVSVLGVSWHGGYESAVKLDAAYRLAERLGVSPVFYDTLNAPHTLTPADANTVVLEISSRYQNDFSQKQQLMIDIDAAATVEAVNALAWL